MTLPVPDLDDKTFARLVEDATKLIPRFAPGWTDHNVHDPGITIIELLAWLVEMQQYRLNRIRDRNYLKFLKLLGIKPRAALPARADVTFTPATVVDATASMLPVPEGAPLAAEEVVFETAEPLVVTTARLKRIITSTKSGMVDNSAVNRPGGLSWFAFGANAEAGSRLYLGFDRPLAERERAGEIIGLTFNLVDYPVAAGRHADEQPDVTPPATIAWEYYQGRDDGPPGAWTELEAADETLMLTRSGRLYFRAPADMQRLIIPPYGCITEPDAAGQPRQSGLYWLRATVRAAGYELPPKLDGILLNTVAAVQRQTISRVITYSGSGEREQTFSASTYLALTGASLIQVRDQGGYWIDWNRSDYELYEEQGQTGRTLIRFDADKYGKAPPEGDDNIRLISCRPEFEDRVRLGRSSGLPNQAFSLDFTPVIAGTLMIQVQEQDSRWRDWIRVDDFDASGSGDPHFVLNADTGAILFGDGVNGDIPPAPLDESTKNIRLVSYAYGGGDRGNVNAGAVTRMVNPVHGLEKLSVNNALPAAGGRPGETLEAAKIRARSEIKIPYRAVTSADYEYLARSTPGLRVARAKAIVTPEAAISRISIDEKDWIRVDDLAASGPGDRHFVLDSDAGEIVFGDGERGAIPPVSKEIRLPLNTAGCRDRLLGNSSGLSNQVFGLPMRAQVIVVPYSQQPKPLPSPGFLQTVRRHLDRHRLITTELEVIAPDYVRVGISAQVSIKKGFNPAQTLQDIQDRLAAFLDPLTGGLDGDGWPFGRNVYESEVYAVIAQAPGTGCVQGVQVDKEKEIRACSLVYSGEHRIEIVNPDSGCAMKAL